MNNILNGTGWGEHPEEEIKIAPWLTHEWKELDRKIEVATEYYEERGRARGRMESRKKQNYRANQWQATAVILGFVLLMAIIQPM